MPTPLAIDEIDRHHDRLTIHLTLPTTAEPVTYTTADGTLHTTRHLVAQIQTSDLRTRSLHMLPTIALMGVFDLSTIYGERHPDPSQAWVQLETWNSITSLQDALDQSEYLIDYPDTLTVTVDPRITATSTASPAS